jgi:hypothetical protein
MKDIMPTEYRFDDLDLREETAYGLAKESDNTVWCTDRCPTVFCTPPLQ